MIDWFLVWFEEVLCFVVLIFFGEIFELDEFFVMEGLVCFD